MKQSKPTVSVDVFVFKGKRLLLGKRKDKFIGRFTYAPPGGHLELCETLRQCAVREVKEETGLSVKLDDVIGIHENNTYGKHYVIICFKAEWIKDEPQLLEPDNCLGWQWYDLDNLPSPLFANNLTTIKNFEKGVIADIRGGL